MRLKAGVVHLHAHEKSDVQISGDVFFYRNRDHIDFRQQVIVADAQLEPLIGEEIIGCLHYIPD